MLLFFDFDSLCSFSSHRASYTDLQGNPSILIDLSTSFVQEKKYIFTTNVTHMLLKTGKILWISLAFFIGPTQVVHPSHQKKEVRAQRRKKLLIGSFLVVSSIGIGIVTHSIQIKSNLPTPSKNNVQNPCTGEDPKKPKIGQPPTGGIYLEPNYDAYNYRYEKEKELLHVTHTYKKEGKVYCTSTYTIKKVKDLEELLSTCITIQRTYPRNPQKNEILELKRIKNSRKNRSRLVELIANSQEHLKYEKVISCFYGVDLAANLHLKELSQDMESGKKFYLGIFHKKASQEESTQNKETSEEESKIIGETGVYPLYNYKIDYEGWYVSQWIGDPKYTKVSGVARLCRGAFQDLLIFNKKVRDQVFHGVVLKENHRSNNCARKQNMHCFSAEKYFTGYFPFSRPAREHYFYTLYAWERIRYFWKMDPETFGYREGAQEVGQPSKSQVKN